MSKIPITTGIPTMYNGVQFRSRLEAKWAALFDLVGWKWEYEPYDLPGWIPDFVLFGEKENVIVEVKPFFKLEEYDTKKIVDAITQSGHSEMDILLLGPSTMRLKEVWADQLSIGWLGEYASWLDESYSEEEMKETPVYHPSWGFDEAVLTTHDGKFDFCHLYCSYHGRMTGGYDGNIGCENPEKFEAYWKKAGNAAQWRRSSITSPPTLIDQIPTMEETFDRARRRHRR